MLVLAFDTSTLQGSAGWVRFETFGGKRRVVDFAQISAPSRPGHAETLLQRLETVLHTGGYEMSSPDLVVFGRGPGTFTGLRIGLSTAKALAVANSTPIVGVSTLEVTALSSGATGIVVPLIDARRGELFGAVYDVTVREGRPFAEMVADECVLGPDRVGELVNNQAADKEVVLVGNGVAPYRELIESCGTLGEHLGCAPNAYWLAVRGVEEYLENGAADPATVEPVYLREPDAKLPTKR